MKSTTLANAMVKVPASTKVVKSFLAENRGRFSEALGRIQVLITAALADVEIYRVYSRKDVQGDDLKHPRKVRLKFNKHYSGKNSGSLWTTPDIIGFTIVVSFPSEISRVCNAIDQLIDRNKLRVAPSSGEPSLESPKKDGPNPIITKYGRTIASQGYFACHYNLVETGPSPGRSPVCEIQIKTILHDAWGAKSHDLTYKPNSKIDIDLVRSFEVLGDMLVKIDEHSDIVRNSIERTSAVRMRKKFPVLEASIKGAALYIVKESELKAIVDAMMEIIDSPDANKLEIWKQTIDAKFEDNNREASIAYVYLAFISRHKVIHQQSLEAIEAWFENEKDDLGKAYARSVSALAMFVNNDTPSAIDEAELAIAILEEINLTFLDENSKKRYSRLLHSTYSSLAYYYAEAIGSHDGRMNEGRSQALHYMGKAATVRHNLGLVFGLLDKEEEILRGFADTNLGLAAYSSLDTEAFVRIQTAETILEVSNIRERLKFIKDNRPQGMDTLAVAQYEFHDFCARCRLAELELESV